MLAEPLLARAQSRLTEPAFAAAAARLRAELREDLARPILVPAPDRPAGYYHDYFCPQHGVQLEFDWTSPDAHRCPVDGAIYRGEPYDRSWWWFVNHAHSEAGYRLALGWRLLGDGACLTRLDASLNAYAAHYPEAGWPKDDPRGRQGKVTYHALDEAVWLIPLAWAYDVARDALPEATRRAVEDRLLAPAAGHLMAQRWPQVHNYMCWLNAGVATAATLVGRDDLLTEVRDGAFGFRQQVAEGVLPDGTWWEGSASYHYYTLAALLAHVRSTGDDAARRDLKRMFEAPLRWAYPDLSLVAINDCWFHSSLVGEVGHGIPPAAAFYEIAAGWYGDAAFESILAQNYGAGKPRDSHEALLFGPDQVPSSPEALAGKRTPRLLTASANLPELGLAVLRSSAPQARDRTFVLLKYGRHGGGHGHPDKLGLILAGGGARLSPDLGTPGYGIGLNESWYRHTLSHNTVLVDGAPQPPATGRLLRFAAPSPRDAESTGFGLIEAAVAWPDDAHDDLLGAARSRTSSENTRSYDGVSMRRLVLLRPHYVLDVFSVTCPNEREVEWAYHNIGTLTALDSLGASSAPEVTVDAPPPTVPDLLTLTHAIRAEAGARATFLTGETHLHLWLASSRLDPTGEEPPPSAAWIIAAGAPANPASELMPLILRRQRTRDALFASLFHPHRGRAKLRRVSWSRDRDTLRCDVALSAAVERWEVPLREHSGVRLKLA